MKKTNIGAKLKQLRLLRNMTQEELAAASGVNSDTIWKYENDERSPTSLTLSALAHALGVTVQELKEPYAPRTVQFLVFLDQGAVMPRRAHAEDAGFDLFASRPDVVPAHGSVIIDTGVHVAIPEGYAGLVISKSGLMFGHDLVSDGLIDAGYTGSIHVKLFNLGETSYIVEKGDKVSQLVFVPIASPDLIRSTVPLDDTERGNGGFGSTGR